MTPSPIAGPRPYKPTNKQGIRPDPRKHHHLQGLTCDCKQCGTEFVQYHEQHVFCSERCGRDFRGVKSVERKCGGCGVVGEVAEGRKGYKCLKCRKLALNPTRTDV